MKFNIKTKSRFNQRAVKQRSDATSLDALYKAGAYVRTAARRKIRKNKKASRPGQPPHTRQGQLRRAILFAVDDHDHSAWVGPSASLISDIAKYHEFGGVQVRKSKRKEYRVGGVGPVDVREGKPNFAFLKTQQQVEKARFIDRLAWPDSSLIKKRKYPARPFMGPALEASVKQLSKIFSVSLSPATSL